MWGFFSLLHSYIKTLIVIIDVNNENNVNIKTLITGINDLRYFLVF